jgi:hypothetical protein
MHRHENELPKFWELAEAQIKTANPKDKIIRLKITIPTAKMMVRNEKLTPSAFNRLRAGNRERVLESIVNGVMQDERYAEAVAETYAKTLTIEEIIDRVHVPS